MASKTSIQILLETDGGLQLFQLLLPDLTMEYGKNKVNIDSPVSKGKKCFSVYKWNDKYLFKDHYNKQSGDIFSLVAAINHLDIKTEFVKVLDIIEALLDSNMAIIPDKQKTTFINYENGDELSVVATDTSKPFVKKYFKELMPYLDKRPDYEIQLVDQFLIEADNKVIDYQFDFSKPQDAFYAIVIREAEYYILFNPKTMKSYSWGVEPEFYMFGMDNIFKTAYTNNVYLRDTLMLTNKVEGLLWCEDKGIPCLAVINNETFLPTYISEVILPLFNDRFILFGTLGKSTEQLRSFVDIYGFTNFMTGESYLYQFFRQGDKAIDRIFNLFESCIDYGYEARKHSVQLLEIEND